MDPKAVQALLQLLQQMSQILQSASAAPTGEPDGDEGDDEEMEGADASMDDDMGDEGDDMEGADASMGDDEMDEDDDEMDDDSLDKDMDETMPMPKKKPSKMMGGGGSSLHDRISALESHTGLKKSASNLPLVQRVDVLEDYHLGEQYEGSVLERVGQLEGIVLGKSASVDDAAPEEIALDDLIKAAVAEGSAKAVKLALQELGLNKSAGRSRELPDLQTMRKAAKTGNPTYGRRRSQATEMTDVQLQKSAQRWGMDGEDLDDPLTLGDSLMALFNAGRGSGGTLSEFMEEE